MSRKVDVAHPHACGEMARTSPAGAGRARYRFRHRRGQLDRHSACVVAYGCIPIRAEPSAPSARPAASKNPPGRENPASGRCGAPTGSDASVCSAAVVRARVVGARVLARIAGTERGLTTVLGITVAVVEAVVATRHRHHADGFTFEGDTARIRVEDHARAGLARPVVDLSVAVVVDAVAGLGGRNARAGTSPPATSTGPAAGIPPDAPLPSSPPASSSPLYKLQPFRPQSAATRQAAKAVRCAWSDTGLDGATRTEQAPGSGCAFPSSGRLIHQVQPARQSGRRHTSGSKKRRPGTDSVPGLQGLPPGHPYPRFASLGSGRKVAACKHVGNAVRLADGSRFS